MPSSRLERIRQEEEEDQQRRQQNILNLNDDSTPSRPNHARSSDDDDENEDSSPVTGVPVSGNNHKTSSPYATRSRASSSAPIRGSYAAAMWNTMKSLDKDTFNRRRLWQLFAGVLIACCGGSAYAFGIFSHQIKETAHFSQSDMTTITTTSSIIGSLVFPAGYIFDKWGPQYVLMCSTVLCCVGMGLLALIFEGRVEATVYSVAAANSLNSIGVGFTDCGSLMPNLFNFPINRGDVVIIQKTFFGLGSTFLSLIFDGFFGPSQNFLGYAITVTAMMFGAGVFGSAVIRLPPYKRTTTEIDRIQKLEDPLQKEAERLFEEKAFEMYHNPRLTDRRRLNLGVCCLLFTLAFFSALSVTKTYVDIPTNVTTGLTVVACVCMMSFALMLVPFQLPAFFDFSWLPDIRPPEVLVDDPEEEERAQEEEYKRKHPQIHPAAAANSRRNGDDVDVESAAQGREYRIRDDQSENAPLISGNNRDENISFASNNTKSLADCNGFNRNQDPNADADDDDEQGYQEQNGRSSAYFNERSSLAGGSAPIAVPKALAPSVIPSITLPFRKSIFQLQIWHYWIMAFGIGAVGVISSNQPQIMTSANNGVFDQKTNSLAVALIGIGSALGRIIIGFVQAAFQRKEAVLREAQLAWEAENGPYDPTVPPKPDQPDMTPIYHRWNSSIVCLMPICPLVGTLTTFLFVFCPYSLFPVIYFFQSVSFGAWIALMVLSVREMFSNEVAQHYNFIYTSSIASALSLNTAMFGTWFDKETEKHRAPDGVSCMGYSCFTNSFYVLGAVCAASTISTTCIAWKWWQVRKTF